MPLKNLLINSGSASEMQILKGKPAKNFFAGAILAGDLSLQSAH
jgi:hypothetical protein